jgi:uncharacterized protein (TIGR03663 family)
MKLRGRVFVAWMLLVLALAAGVRLARLDRRPMHCDEANQAVKAAVLWRTGEYRYDVTDHHGPSLYWLTLPSLALSGAKSFAETNEWSYRIVPAVFGIGAITLFFLFADGLGRGAVLAAALLTAVSAPMVFYSRYYIQETLLAFFTLGSIGTAWRYARTRKLPWAIAAGLCLGMMHATKETWILAAAAGIVAIAITIWTNRGRKGSEHAGQEANLASGSQSSPAPLPLFVPLLAAAIAACLVAVALYSGFGRSWDGPWKSIIAFGNYWHRGREAVEHIHPYYYYANLLFAYYPARGFFFTEGFVAALAVVGASVSLCPRLCAQSPQGDRGANLRLVPSPALLRFLALFTLALFGLYSLVPYKTPWCVLSFYLAMILLAGVGWQALVQIVPGRAAKALVLALLAAGTAHLGWQSYRLNFRLAADARNPYVYAHTPYDVPRLAERLNRFANSLSGGNELSIHVVVPDNCWPLPWYLRRFNQEHVCFWTDAARWVEESRSAAPPDLLFVGAEACDAVDAGLPPIYNCQVMFALRPGVFVRLYVRQDLWPAFIAASDALESRL